MGLDPILYFLFNVQNGKKGNNNNMKLFPLFIYKWKKILLKIMLITFLLTDFK